MIRISFKWIAGLGVVAVIALVLLGKKTFHVEGDHSRSAFGRVGSIDGHYQVPGMESCLCERQRPL